MNFLSAGGGAATSRIASRGSRWSGHGNAVMLIVTDEDNHNHTQPLDLLVLAANSEAWLKLPMTEEDSRTLNFYAIDGTCHLAALWLFNLTKDQNASKICNTKAKIWSTSFSRCILDTWLGCSTFTFWWNILLIKSLHVSVKFPRINTFGSFLFSFVCVFQQIVI